MRFDPKKIILQKKFNYEEALVSYEVLKNILEREGSPEMYYYVSIKDMEVFVDIIESDHVYWMAHQLNVTNKEAVFAICDYPGFLYDLRDVLCVNGINGLKRYEPVTECYLMQSDCDDYGDYISQTKEDAEFYFKEIQRVPDLLYVTIAHDDEENKEA